MLKIIIFALLLFSSINGAVSAAEADVFEIEAEGSYQMNDAASIELAKKLALFSAKRQAVDLAGRYLSRQSLIAISELKRDEIYSLAAREIAAEVLEEKRQTVGKILTYTLRIRARVQISDFVKAEMEDARQKKDEAKERFSEEMEQRVAAEIDPGIDISKAYRLLREKKWRIAAIYLNHLEKKYPNWDSLYMAKAITHYVLHEPVFMKKALNKACLLGNTVACEDLKNLKRLHEYDFGLSMTD